MEFAMLITTNRENKGPRTPLPTKLLEFAMKTNRRWLKNYSHNGQKRDVRFYLEQLFNFCRKFFVEVVSKYFCTLKKLKNMRKYKILKGYK